MSSLDVVELIERMKKNLPTDAHVWWAEIVKEDVISILARRYDLDEENEDVALDILLEIICTGDLPDLVGEKKKEGFLLVLSRALGITANAKEKEKKETFLLILSHLLGMRAKEKERENRGLKYGEFTGNQEVITRFLAKEKGLNRFSM